MALKCDFHIHTKYLGCANETMELDAIARRCREVGAECIGITDHLNTPDRLEFKKFCRSCRKHTPHRETK